MKIRMESRLFASLAVFHTVVMLGALCFELLLPSKDLLTVACGAALCALVSAIISVAAAITEANGAK